MRINIILIKQSIRNSFKILHANLIIKTDTSWFLTLGLSGLIPLLQVTKHYENILSASGFYASQEDEELLGRGIIYCSFITGIPKDKFIISGELNID